MKVVVLGSTGMLGGMMVRKFKEDGLDVVGISRKDGLQVGPYHNVGVLLQKILTSHNPDFIVNCIGAIKPVFSDRSTVEHAIYTNAIFPYELIRWNKSFNIGAKIIHITTDCVYDGRDGYYTEESLHNPLDEYGKSKSLGEPDDCMVIRTSIIGPEWGGNKRSLIEWVLSNRGKEINGYTNHLWNGITTLELSRCVSDIIWNDMHCCDTRHLYSTDVDKKELLDLMNRSWELGMTINSTEAASSCNRTLRTSFGLNGLLQPSNTAKMIDELKPYIMDR